MPTAPPLLAIRPQMAARLWHFRAHLSLTSIVLGACGEGTRPESEPPPLTRTTMQQYLTDTAAASLTAAGQWILPVPKVGDNSQLTSERAESLALVWPRQFGPWVLSRLESEHGDAIDLNALARCGRIYYAASPYEQLDASTAAIEATKAAQRAFGPWWLVTLCSKTNVPQLSVAIAAYAAELHIEDGQIVMPRLGGEWFSVEGIPHTLDADFLQPPEEAARMMALASRLRVAAVPELIVPARSDGFPNHARWRIKLDGRVPARGSTGRLVMADEYYTWRRPGAESLNILIPAISQLPGLTFRYPANITTADADERLTYAEGFLPRRASIAVAFESVTLSSGK